MVVKMKAMVYSIFEGYQENNIETGRNLLDVVIY